MMNNELNLHKDFDKTEFNNIKELSADDAKKAADIASCNFYKSELANFDQQRHPGYILGKVYDGIIFVYNGTFKDCFKQYTRYTNTRNLDAFFKAIDGLDTIDEMVHLYENYFNDHVEVIIKCNLEDILRDTWIEMIDCKNPEY